MNDHHLLALLEGRDAENLKEWLNNHHKIKIVARDRASSYAAAISEINITKLYSNSLFTNG